MKKFKMIDLDITRYFLGLEVDQSLTGIFVSQRMYIKDISRKIKMMKWNPVFTPMESKTKLSKNGEAIVLMQVEAI